ncbi:YoaK family protein [Arthrobacter sp. SDTb3-6]|uniref:YoaK family protein n=1 Tax=Arthrobacter sp. SDTb3-6 TaxID=2713571 RepID=UPI00210D0CF3|nr:YoaK family protein [Arthrobacter sp. SDTb3-6]
MAGALSLAAGFVDAVGFIHLGGYFVSFMSGNSTRAGAALAEGHPLGFLLAMGLVGAFTAGVISASILRRLVPSRKRMWVLLYVAAALGSAVVLYDLNLAVWLAPPVMALAMGAENVIFERDGEVSIGLTYMTGTLVKMGQRMAAALAGEDRLGWVRYLFLWLSLTMGSIVGGFAYFAFNLNALWVSVGIFVLAMAVNVRSRTPETV